jgi:cation diffusion facilitator family transporter
MPADGHHHAHAVERARSGGAAGHGHSHGAEHGHSHGADHGHSHGGVDPAVIRSREAMRALWLSLTILGATAAFQVVIVLLSGSVALLADTVHNVGDALTAVPLAVAFILLRRPRTQRLTYGWGRAEDFAGLVVVAIILFSAVYAAYEAIDRLVHPQAIEYLGATAAAGLVGFIGNEWVAVYRIRAGRRIGSAALVADGYHARVDGFTSLAVVVGAAGVALGWERADPVVGLLISIAILHIVWQSLRVIGLRAMDGIEDGTVEAIEASAGAVAGIQRVDDVRARWLGHSLRAELTVVVEPQITVAEAAEIVDRVRRTLLGEVDHLTEVSIETVGSGADVARAVG